MVGRKEEGGRTTAVRSEREQCSAWLHRKDLIVSSVVVLVLNQDRICSELLPYTVNLIVCKSPRARSWNVLLLNRADNTGPKTENKGRAVLGSTKQLVSFISREPCLY